MVKKYSYYLHSFPTDVTVEWMAFLILLYMYWDLNLGVDIFYPD